LGPVQAQKTALPAGTKEIIISDFRASPGAEKEEFNRQG